MERLTLRDDDGRALFTPYGLRIYCSTQATADCICKLEEAVKAQEPRVLTLDEIKDGESYWFSAGKEFVTRPVICVRREDDAQIPYITFVWQFGTFSWELEDYGKKWRCWNVRPTDAERRKVAWE